MARASLASILQMKHKDGVAAPSRQPRPIAIDFGASALKVLQVTGSETPSIIAAASLDTPEELFDDPAGRISFQAQQLPQLIRSAGFKGKRAVCLLPVSLTFCKHIQVPKGDAHAIESGTKIALASQLGVDPSMLVLRHNVVGLVGAEQNRVEVIGMAAARSTVDLLMRSMVAAKLEPVGMHPEFGAALAGFNAIGAAPEDKTTLYLDLGFGTTKAFIARGSRLMFARAFDFGGRALDKSLAARWKVSVSRAHEARRSDGDYTGVQRAPMMSLGSLNGAAGGSASGNKKTPSVMPDLKEAFEILSDEVGMCIRYHRNLFPNQPVERAVFTGGESANLGLCRRLAGAVRVAVQTGDPMGAIQKSGKEPAQGVDLSGPLPGFAAALGLSMCPTDL